MLVCSECRKLGKSYKEDLPSKRTYVPQSASPSIRTMNPPVRRKAAQLPREINELDLTDDLAEKVRKHRRSLGISQEELARRVKEKLSVIQKIETGKMTPDTRLCRELEHELKVKLLVPHEEDETPNSSAPADVTLGDIIQLKDKTKASGSISS